MENKINRVNEAVERWIESEKLHARLYPEIVDKPSFARTRLRELNIVMARFSSTTNPEERDSLTFLKVETKRLAQIALKSKYNWRYAVNFLLKPFTVNRVAANRNREVEANHEKLFQSIKTSGFGQFAKPILEMIKQGKKDFTYSVPFQINKNEYTEFKLHISYDPVQGHSFNSYQAQYINKTKPGEIRNHTISVDQGGYDKNEVMDLIAGKAIYKPGDGWKQLDFTDKDNKGSYRIITTDEKNFDLEKCCESLPFWNKLTQREKTAAMLNLKFNPADALIEFRHQEVKHQVYLRASPLKQEILTFNVKGQSVNLNVVFRSNHEHQTNKTTMKVVKGASVGKTRIQSQKQSNQYTTKQGLGKGVKPRPPKIIR